MDKFLTFTIVGLSTAAIYAVIASGLVLTYTTTGIFNFAHGAAGMLAAFCYWQFRFGWGWSTPLALFVVLFVLGPLFGALLELVIMRGLQGTSEAVKLVVSISLLVFMIGLAQIIWKPGVSRPMSTFFASSKPIHIGPTTITWHQAITILVAVAVAIGLRFFLYWVRVGIAMRAAVDDRPLSSLNGARPDRVSMHAWAVGTSLAALGGILVAPNVSLDAASLSLLIVNAYAAAIFGRLRSLPLTFVGALVIGGAQAYLAGYLPSNAYLTNLKLASPAIILFIVLLVLPNPRLRSRVRSREYFRMPSRRGSLVFAASVVIGAVVMATTMSGADLTTYGQVFGIGIIALSLVPLIGFAGQISLCQMSIAAIGALVAAHLGASGNPIVLVWAVLVSAVIGAIVALPALRLSGIYLALGTAAFSLALDNWIFQLPAITVFGWFRLNFFAAGSISVPPLRFLGTAINTPAEQTVFVAVLFALCALGVVWIRRGSFGRKLIAMKESEAACATLGLNLLGTKVLVFALASGMAGLGGALFTMQAGVVTAQQFSLPAGLPVFMLAVVGGIGAVGSGLFAGVALNAGVPLWGAILTSLTKYQTLLPGLAGLGLARDPNGAVNEMREGFEPLTYSRSILGATLVLMAGAWVLRIADVLDGWSFVILLLGIPIVGVILSGALARKGARTGAVGDVPWEWRGITRPWRVEDIRTMDRVLAVSEVELHAAARRP